jgi:RHS repeat-associated protein
MFTQTSTSTLNSLATEFVSSYRFAFNGKEQDNEIAGVTGANLDFGARIYDSRVGRWLACDPLSSKYSELSPYQFCAGNPILFIDKDGKIIVIGGIEYVPPEKRTDDYIKQISNSNSFVQETFQSLDYIYQNANEIAKDGSTFNKLQNVVNSEYSIEITETSGTDTRVSPGIEGFGALFGEKASPKNIKNNLLFFNPKKGMQFQGGSMSPTEGLAHEIDHTWELFTILDGLSKLSDYISSDVDKDLFSKAQAYENSDPWKGGPEEQRAVGKGSLEQIIGTSLCQYSRTNYNKDNQTFIQSYNTTDVLSAQPNVTSEQKITEGTEVNLDVKTNY